ncbi:MAG: hypothetical protein ACQXXL_08355 [Candidatus Methanosuratincola sp.]|jgi:hypothetical protein
MATCKSFQLRLDSGVLQEDASVTYQFYPTLDGKRRKLISKVGSGSRNDFIRRALAEEILRIKTKLGEVTAE